MTLRFYYWTDEPNSVMINFTDIEADSYALAWFELRLLFLDRKV